MKLHCRRQNNMTFSVNQRYQARGRSQVIPRLGTTQDMKNMATHSIHHQLLSNTIKRTTKWSTSSNGNEGENSKSNFWNIHRYRKYICQFINNDTEYEEDIQILKERNEGDIDVDAFLVEHSLVKQLPKGNTINNLENIKKFLVNFPEERSLFTKRIKSVYAVCS